MNYISEQGEAPELSSLLISDTLRYQGPSVAWRHAVRSVRNRKHGRLAARVAQENINRMLDSPAHPKARHNVIRDGPGRPATLGQLARSWHLVGQMFPFPAFWS